MELILLFARLFLAVIFGVAGTAKVFDLKGSQNAVAGFGVPQSLATPFGIMLPLAEIALAVMLLPLETAWFGAAGAVLLVALFIGGIIYQMAQGNAPDCHCFGQIHSAPVGWSTLGRNFLFLAIAGFIVIFGYKNAGTSAVAWLFALTVTEKMILLFGLSIVALFVFANGLLYQILKQQRFLGRQIELLDYLAKTENAPEIERAEALPPTEGLPVGAIAPHFELPDAFGVKMSLEGILKSGKKPLVLFFVSPTCQPCQALLPEIDEWQRRFGDKITFALISSGTVRENQAKLGTNGDKLLLLQKERETAEIFRAKWTPTAVFINAGGKIGSKLAVGDAQIRDLVGKVTLLDASLNGHSHVSAKETKIKIGDFAPDFSLPNLDGKTVSLASFRGQTTLLLFWGVGCGYCNRMLDDLRAWEAQYAPQNFQLLIVSMSAAAELREQHLRSPILLEKDNEVSKKYEFGGTPSGYIIDAEGKIASELATGKEDVFALVGHFEKVV